MDSLTCTTSVIFGLPLARLQLLRDVTLRVQFLLVLEYRLYLYECGTMGARVLFTTVIVKERRTKAIAFSRVNDGRTCVVYDSDRERTKNEGDSFFQSGDLAWTVCLEIPVLFAGILERRTGMCLCTAFHEMKLGDSAG